MLRTVARRPDPCTRNRGSTANMRLQRAREVRIHGLPVTIAGRVGCPARMRDRRIVRRDVGPAETVPRRIQDAVPRIGCGDVERHRDSIRADLVGQALDIGQIDVGGDDAVA